MAAEILVRDIIVSTCNLARKFNTVVDEIFEHHLVRIVGDKPFSGTETDRLNLSGAILELSQWYTTDDFKFQDQGYEGEPDTVQPVRDLADAIWNLRDKWSKCKAIASLEPRLYDQLNVSTVFIKSLQEADIGAFKVLDSLSTMIGVPVDKAGDLAVHSGIPIKPKKRPPNINFSMAVVVLERIFQACNGTARTEKHRPTSEFMEFVDKFQNIFPAGYRANSNQTLAKRIVAAWNVDFDKYPQGRTYRFSNAE